MHTLEGLPMWDYYKNLLTTPDKGNALRVINEFFRLFGEKDPQEQLWYILTTALRSENEEIEARHRGNMIFFYEYSVVFFKAVKILAETEAPKATGKKKAKKPENKPSPE
jgi:hypothetical protein